MDVVGEAREGQIPELPSFPQALTHALFRRGRLTEMPLPFFVCGRSKYCAGTRPTIASPFSLKLHYLNSGDKSTQIYL